MCGTEQCQLNLQLTFRSMADCMDSSKFKQLKHCSEGYLYSWDDHIVYTVFFILVLSAYLHYVVDLFFVALPCPLLVNAQSGLIHTPAELLAPEPLVRQYDDETLRKQFWF